MGNVCWLNVEGIAIVQTYVNYKESVGAFSKFDQVLKGHSVDAEYIKSVDIAILKHCINKLTLLREDWSLTAERTQKFVDHFAMDNFSSFCHGKSRLVFDLSHISSMVEHAASSTGNALEFAKIFVHEIKRNQQGYQSNLIKQKLISLFPNLRRITIVAPDGFEFSIRTLLEELSKALDISDSISKVEIVGVLHKDEKRNWLSKRNWGKDVRKTAKDMNLYLSEVRDEKDRECRLNITTKRNTTRHAPKQESLEFGRSQ